MQFEKEAYAINIDLKRGNEQGLVGFPPQVLRQERACLRSSGSHKIAKRKVTQS